jgi:ABC-type nickel/cobalt efflux system permease component RcnA
MAADKEKIAKGIRSLAIALPLIFTAPGLYFLAGMPASRTGNYWWMAASLILMLVAVFFMVKGLRQILAGFFNDEQRR